MPNPTKELIDEKIIFAGFDNAGKTSFLIALRQKYNFYERVHDLLPTIKIEFSSFKILKRWRIDFWDMGGQAKYRAIYIENPVYFDKTDYMYYIIDIQDDKRFHDSIAYLGNLLKILKDKEYSNEFIICFHKLDPNIRDNIDYHKKIEFLINLIQKNYTDFSFKFFLTSIYDIASLSMAMAYSLNQILNLSGLHETIRNFAVDYNCQYIYLFTDSGVIITDYYNKPIDTFEFEELIKSKVNENLMFFQNIIDQKGNLCERTTLFRDKSEYVKMIKIKTSLGELGFYLSIICPNEDLFNVKEKSQEFQQILESIFSF